jgi:chemotaxis methyl-accepting protein methylase
MREAVDEAARLLARRVGLRLDPAIRGRLARAVRDEAKRRDEDPEDYVDQLDRDAAALQDLLNRVTVQETSFFRDPAQFVALATEVLPALREAGEPVHVWSAGCANGQEAYSLAMVLAESGLADWDVVASDISTKALARTAAARYAERELGGLSTERRARHLVPADGSPDMWEVSPRLRQRVLTVRHNLAVDPPPIPAGRSHIVFCRNVLIYFGHDDVVSFLDRLSAWLPTGAHLFLGYSESLWLVSERFHLVRLGDAFVYRNGAAPAPTPRAPRARVPTNPVAAPSPPPSRSPSPPPSSPPPPPPIASDPEPSGADGRRLLAEGEAAMGAREYSTAVTAFRKAAFLDPDEPMAHLSLGLALEALGDQPAAQRAYAAARAALDRSDTASVETTLEGYRLDEFTRLLDLKAGTR